MSTVQGNSATHAESRATSEGTVGGVAERLRERAEIEEDRRLQQDLDYAELGGES
ncbi:MULTISPECIES: hypothetical protein [unclassified Geodermatophilus]